MAPLVRQRRRVVACAVATLTALAGCEGARDGREDPSDWYDSGENVEVVEPLEFTAVNYDFAEGGGILELQEAVFPVASLTGADRLVFGPEDAAAASDACNISTNSELPYIIEGVVTAHPRFYFKSSGCSWDSDEKFYGSFFIQDATGGQMVLGDTKVAKFDMGDRVRILARGVKTSFDLDMVYTYDLLEIVERAEPIYYETQSGPFGCDRTTPIDFEQCDTGKVKRITGTVVSDKDTFGEFLVEGDDGTEWSVSLDVELNRRGVEYPVGTRLTATGPILFSYNAYSLVVMRKGQIQVLED